MSNKLELTWIGKDKELKIEPRILIENPTLSNTAQDTNTDNMLIHGDNLLALKALESKYAGQVKCIYIDPPYNTGSAFEHYDDNLEHSTWLNLMMPRLEILRNLLSNDGIIYIQIDDNEYAYLKVLCDEIFGRKNFISSICIKMSTVSGVKTAHKNKTIIKEKEIILVYAKDADNFAIIPQYIPLSKIDDEFQYYLDKHNSDDPDCWEIKRLKEVLVANGIDAENEEQFQKFINLNAQFIWRRAFIRNEYKALSQQNPDKIFYITKNGQEHYYYRGREMFFLADKFHDCFTEEGYKHAISDLLGDIWLDINTGKLFNEGNVEFRNSKKPEFLIARMLEMSSKKGDLILDSFLGSGTTAAVAHKMGRKYIGIEMGDHAYTHCKVRLDKVISGEDKGGITKSVNWQSGGGYRFYEIAPTLIVEDKFGNPIINREYNAEMLAAAMALHEGFEYAPDANYYWKQGKNENAYIFTTTTHLTESYLDAISKEMQDGEYLVIACKSFDSGIDRLYKNIKVKKIPQYLLGRCEFGKDNYNLNIVDVPVYDDEEE
ncbi:MAG: site-specific DNA-methyltransferase [Clostridiales bacterium]|nr:site-specific DNA-methyltransferase [Clostridiales bacterium]